MKKVCVVTGTRAEYGLLFWLMKEIQNEPSLALQVVATGMHLRPMVRIKAPKAAPDFKSPSRHANGCIFDICVRWRNAEGDLKDKQMGGFILIMGLSPEFGLTYKEIEKDFKIDKKVEMLLSSDTPVGISKSMGLPQISFADAYEKLKPDLLVVLEPV